MQYGKEFQEKCFVSPFNFSDTATKNMKFKDKVNVYDVTLREGEQHYGVSFSKEQKISLVRKMAEARIPFVEISLVAASTDDQEVIKEMCAEDLGGTTVTALCRLMESDVDLAKECGLEYIGIITMLNDTNLVAHKWTLEEAYNNAVKITAYARKKGFDHIAMMVPDGTKLPKERLKKIFELVGSNIDSVCINDTFSSLSPTGAAAFIDEVQPLSANPIELHCHNDFGFGAANAIAAASRGCPTVHASFLGIGEKTGNTRIEELILGLEMLYGVNTGIDLTKIAGISKLVSEYTGIPALSNTPVVGLGVRALVSPTAVAQQLRIVNTPEDWKEWGTRLTPFLPSAIGLSDEPEVALGKASGAANVEWFLKKWNVALDKDAVKKIVGCLKEYAIHKGGGGVSEDELCKIVKDLKYM
jgi:isopropylmalate/homocitrate/citramalate synthase